MIVVPLKIWCRKKAGGWGIMGFDEAFTLMGAAFVTAVFAVIYSGMSKVLRLAIPDGSLINPLRCSTFVREEVCQRNAVS